MNSLKWLGVIGIFVVVVGVLGFTLLRGVEAAPGENVYINETSDHRFDESIEVSILAAKNRTGVQNAVVITDRFEVAALEAKAAELFKALRLGEKTQGRAILYLYSPKTKSLKIEVGYALEGEMPDVQVHRFEQAAKGFTFNDRYQDFWAELINTVNIEIFEQEHQSGTQALGSKSETESDLQFLSGGAGIVAHDYTANIDDLIKQMGPSPKCTEYEGSDDIKKSLEAYLASLGAGVGAEKIGILSRTSRFFRTFTPMTEAQLKRNWKMYEKAGIDQIFREGGFAYVFYKRNHPVLPIVLVFQSGAWRVDEPRSWVLFQRFENSQQVFLKYPLDIKNTAFRAYIDSRFPKTLYKKPNVDASAYTQDPKLNAYLNYYWLERAAFDIKGASDDELWVRLDVENNLGRFRDFVRTLRRLSKLEPDDKRLASDMQYYEKLYRFDGPDWLHQMP